jgi:simple sugar transport system ATP-binding protein
VLAPPEVEGLLKLLRRLAREGMAVALVAHKLDEVLSVADRVTVLREGRVALQAPRREVDLPILVRAMVGGEAADEAAEIRTVQPDAVTPESPVGRYGPGDGAGGAELPDAFTARAGGEVVARLDGVELAGEGGRPLLAGVDLVVRRGEVVGIAGVEGNGQRELALLLAGRIAAHAGRVDLPARTGFVPEDRIREGLIAGFTLTENLALALHEDPRYRAGPFLRWGRLGERARALVAAYAVKAPGAGARVAQLSGGNQQRWVVARELSGEPALLVAENPTRGLDVSAAAFVHRQLRGSAGVVLISTDLDEVLRLSDRVLVMLRGRLVPVPPAERSRSTVGRMMLAGGAPASATVTEPADGSSRP